MYDNNNDETNDYFDVKSRYKPCGVTLHFSKSIGKILRKKKTVDNILAKAIDTKDINFLIRPFKKMTINNAIYCDSLILSSRKLSLTVMQNIYSPNRFYLTC